MSPKGIKVTNLLVQIIRMMKLTMHMMPQILILLPMKILKLEVGNSGINLSLHLHPIYQPQLLIYTIINNMSHLNVQMFLLVGISIWEYINSFMQIWLCINIELKFEAFKPLPIN